MTNVNIFRQTPKSLGQRAGQSGTWMFFFGHASFWLERSMWQCRIWKFSILADFTFGSIYKCYMKRCLDTMKADMPARTNSTFNVLVSSRTYWNFCDSKSPNMAQMNYRMTNTRTYTYIWLFWWIMSFSEMPLIIPLERLGSFYTFRHCCASIVLPFKSRR